MQVSKEETKPKHKLDGVILQFKRPEDIVILTAPCAAFDETNPLHLEAEQKLLKIAADNKDICAGLSASQIGEKLCLFVVVFEDYVLSYRNPKVIPLLNSGIKNEYEGCLSLNFGDSKSGSYVRRHNQVIVNADNREPRKYKGFLSRVFQHEADHLKGRVV